ncbi:MAG: peptidoglycan recognition protein family protein [Acidimicrobiales bacterium]
MFKRHMRQTSVLLALALAGGLIASHSLNPSAVGAAGTSNGTKVETVVVVDQDSVRAQATTGQGIATQQVGVEPFRLIGASWSGGGTAQMRTHGAQGWSAWLDIELDAGDAPDSNSTEGRGSPLSSKPTWVGIADGYEFHFPLSATQAQIYLVRDSGEQRVQASANPNQPGIHPRSVWGARDPKVALTNAPKIQMGFVHHTVNANGYAAADVPAMLRSIQAYHMDSNGWDDIGYNFLVDRFGTAWEGRAGSLNGPVIGAHTGGFNTGSVGVAIIGDFQTVGPSQESVVTASRVLGWKLGISGVDPNGTATMTSNGNDKFPEGEVVTFLAVAGHRDGKSTSCPGQRLYDQLPGIRNAAALTAAAITTPIGSLDLVSIAPGGIRVAGWNLDPDTAAPIGVHTYIDGNHVSSITANTARHDIAGTFAGYGPEHGFDTIIGVGAGAHTVCSYSINVGPGTNSLLGCRGVMVTDTPIGSLDLVTMSPGGIRVAGWALDPNAASPVAVHIYVDGNFSGSFTADAPRSDIASIFPSYGAAHGFDTLVGVGPGYHQVCTYSINIGPGANSLIGCRVIPTSDNPIGSLDLVTPVPGGLRVAGWTLDPNVAGSIDIHIYVDGNFAGSFTANTPRSDVATILPSYGAAHGFDALVGVGPGSHQVCTYAISVGPGTNSFIGCRSV